MPNTEFALWREKWNLTRLVVHELMDAAFVWRGRNTHAFNRCFWVLEGNGAVVNHSANQCLELTPGFAAFLPCGADLEFDFRPGLHFLSIHFNLEILPGLDICRNVRQCRTVPFDIPEGVRMLELLHAPPDYCRLNDLELFVRGTLERCAISSEDPETLARIAEKYGPLLRYIRGHLSARLDVEELASFANLSRSTLSRRFAADFNMTLKEFLQKELAKEATRFLRVSDIPVSAVAEKLRFSSGYYFSNFFRRVTGMSPRECRALSQKMK